MDDNEQLTPEAGQEVVTDADEKSGAEDTEGQAEGQTAEDQEGEQPEPEESEEDKKRKESARQRRERDKASRQRLRDEAESARQQAAEADRRRMAIMDAGRQGEAPRRDQFQDPAEFAAARAVWQYQQQAAEQAAGEAVSAAETARQQAQSLDAAERQIALQQWTEQVVEARARYADFDEVAMADSVPVTAEMADVIRSSDAAADVAYYLGKNKAEAARIAKMAPYEMAREIGRIEGSLSVPKPRSQSKAPPPTRPLKGGAAGVKSPETMSADEYRAWREAGGKF